MEEKPKAFVIMPFDLEFTSIYQKLIKQSLEEAGYDVARADSFLDQQNILSSVVRGITTAELIVADLTTNNPNVFYELGLCHGLGKPTVLIAQSINDVPFDLRSYNILVYETHFNKIEKLKDLLKEIGTKHRSKEIMFSSPVSDFSANKIEEIEVVAPITSAVAPITSDPIPDDVIEEVGEPELLDYLKDGEIATQDLTSILARLLKDNEVVTHRINKHAMSMQALTSNPKAGSAGRYHKISLLAASDMNNFSRKVEDILPGFEDTIERINENYLGFIGLADPQTQDRDGIDRLRKAMKALLLNSKEANTSMHSFRDAVIELGEKKISKDLSRASRRLAEALNGIISNMQRVEAFSIKALAMMDDRFTHDLEQ